MDDMSTNILIRIVNNKTNKKNSFHTLSSGGFQYFATTRRRPFPGNTVQGDCRKATEGDGKERFVAGMLSSTVGYLFHAEEKDECAKAVDALVDCGGDFSELTRGFHGEKFVPYLALCVAGRIASVNPKKLSGAVKLIETVDSEGFKNGFRYFFRFSSEWGKEKEDILRKTEYGINSFLSKFGDGECSVGDMCALFSLVERIGKTGWPEETVSAYLESISGTLAGGCGDDPEAEVVPALY